MTTRKVHRIQAEFSPQLKLLLEQIVVTAGVTKKEVIVDALLMLREHILKCQEGYMSVYIKRDNPSDFIQVESKYDQLRLPYTTE